LPSFPQMNNSSVITSVLRPVMTTGIAASGHQQRHQVRFLNRLPCRIRFQDLVIIETKSVSLG
jgi:hypothetical protein